MSMPALAQQSSTAETVVVTGSRIPQTGIYSTSPVTAVNQQELKFEGTTDVTTLVNNLPSVFVDQNAGVSNGASGTANVDLRGLGAKRTLVLVDGTRLMPGDPQDPVADLNDIPAALVDHVDVLTGGASAVYGSDALGGVVNFVMRHDFEGVEIDGTYSVNEADNNQSNFRNLISEEGGAPGFNQSKEGIWNGQTEDTTFLIGSNTENGKGNITGYLSYRSVSAVWESSRDYSACTIGVSGPQSLSCAGSSNYNRFISLDNLEIGGGGTPWDNFELGTGAPGSGTFVPFTGVNQLFNYGALNYIQRPDTRYTGGFFAHYDENKELNIYANFMFANDQTQGQLAPSAVFLGSGTVSGYAQNINCGNPLMTAQENKILCGDLPGDTQTTVIGPSGPFTFWNGNGNFTPGQAKLEVGRRALEAGDRQYNFQHGSYRMQIGAKGDLGNGWSYDVYGQYGYTTATQDIANQLSKARVQSALEVDPTTGQCFGNEINPPTAPGCVPLDIFNGFGSISRAMLGYSGATGLQTGFTEEAIVSGSITGDLGAWGGQSPWAKNPIAVSIGSEYRQERLGLSPDYEEQSNDLYGAGGPVAPVPNSGFNVTEGFTEVKVPLIQEMPFVEDFTLNGGYRYSSYNIAGATTTYKYGAEWQPIDDFRVRGSVQRAVRAPNVLELFSPDSVGLFSGQDPCSAGANGGAGPNGNEVHNCSAATGGAHVNPGNVNSPILTCPATQCNAESGGNLHLKPEVSETRTIGLVLTPSFFDGFNATVDWFNIKVNKFIAGVSPNLALDECYNSGPNPDSFFCNFVHRSPASQQIFGNGFVQATGTNTGYLQTKGIDFETNYTTDLSNFGLKDFGSVDLNVKGTWLTDLSTSEFPNFPAFNCAGQYGLICGTPNPKWRQYTRVTWSSPWDVDFSLAWRYIGAVGLDADSSDFLVGGNPGNTLCPGGKTIQGIGDCWDSRLSSYSYIDLSFDWTVREGIDLRGGVNNVFNLEPPVIGTAELPLPIGNGNTFAGVYDTLGREFFAGVTIKY
jgi:outer membrane receptor protein involved in Fe transport